MAITLNKTITRNSDNTIDTLTNFNDLNLKAGNLVDDIVTQTETNLASLETQVNTIASDALASQTAAANSASAASTSETNAAASELAASNYATFVEGARDHEALVDFSRVDSYVKADGTRWLKNDGKGVDGEMLSGQMLDKTVNTTGIVSRHGTINASDSVSFLFSCNIKEYTNSAVYGDDYKYTWVGLSSGGKLNLRDVVAGSVFSSSIIPLNTYARCAIVLTDTNVSFYIDGVLDTTTSFSAKSDFSLDLFLSCVNTTTYAFNGIIGNVEIIKAELTADDIALDYAQPELILGVATNTIQSPFSFDTNDVLACFPLNEGTMGGGNVWDVKNSTSYAISNYATTMWTNADNLAYGIQQTLLVKDDVNNFVTGISKYACEVINIGNPTLSPYYEVLNSGTDAVISSITPNSFNIVNTTGAESTLPRVLSKWNNDVTIEANKSYRISFDYVVNSGIAQLKYLQLPNGSTSTLNRVLSGSGKIESIISGTSSKTLDSSEYFLQFDTTTYNTFDIDISNIKIEKVEYSELPQLSLGSQGTIDTGIFSMPNGKVEPYTICFAEKQSSYTTRASSDYALGFETEVFGLYRNYADNRRDYYIDGAIGRLDNNETDDVFITMSTDENSNCKWYINGELIKQEIVSIDLNRELKLGYYFGVLANSDDKFLYLKLFDKQLTDFEVSELYNNIKTNAPTLALP